VWCAGIRLPGAKQSRKSYSDLGRKYLIGKKPLTSTSPERRAAREWLTGSFRFDITELEAFVVVRKR
jgi:hypothetical protein